ncbi:MAG: hypothetical protein A2X45_08680 [Lentisphaerae bacterium GWF2_50_93]|nr:MAG: hypothetical protein A2X45_08680 [Lentisphaerae bacterium GWF2_50_93]
MFYNFKCSVCKNDIQAEYQYIGELVSCPICDSAQIVPDPPLPVDSIFSGYKIIDIYASTHLWTSYKAVGETELPGQEVLLRIPSSFYLKNDANAEALFNVILRTGSSNIEGFPALLDRSMTPGKVFFVYECNHKAKTLSGFASKVMPISSSDSIQIVRKIACSLNKAWEKEGLIHQNLKPSNVRLDEDGDISILEFGLSQSLIGNSYLLNKGFNIWDYRYMSPEFILSGQASDQRCDIYSLGGVFYLLLTGRHPYRELTPQEVPNAPLPDPREFNYEVPASYISILEKMMSKDLGTRYQSWNELISHINTSCPEVLGAPQPAASSLARINISALTTGRFEAFGQPAGEFSDEKKKTVKLKTEKIRKRKLTDTIAKINPALIGGINRQWKNGRNMPPDPDKANAKLFLVTVGIIFAVLTIVSIVVIINIATRKNTPPAPVAQDQSIIPAVVPSSKTDIKYDAAKAADQKPVAPAVKTVTVKAPASTPEKTFKEICDFYDSNPETNLTEAYSRFNALKSESIKINDVKLIQEINDRQQAMEIFKKKKVTDVIEKLKTVTATYIKEGDQAKAIEIIEKYSGEYAEESVNERRTLISSLKTEVAESNIAAVKADLDSSMGLGNFEQAELMAKNFKGKTEDETLKQRQELSNYVEDRKVKFIREVYPLYNEAAINFMAGKNDLTLEKIRAFLERAGLPAESASFAANLSENISSFKNLSLAASTLDEKIKVCDSLIKGDSSTLKGMLCMQEKSYDKAKEFFKGVKCNLGSGFIRVATEREAEFALTTLLVKYDMTFNPEKSEQFLLELTQKKIQDKNAANLVAGLSQYNDKYKDTAFVKKYDNIIEAVRKFCKRAGAEDTDKSRKTVTIQAETPQECAALLLKSLSEKTEGMSITLKPGVYHSERLREFNINQNGTKIFGDTSTIIKNNILVTAKDVTVSGVTLDGAWIACTDNARNITFRNCVFKSDLTKILTCSTVSFQNCLFKGLLIENSSAVSLNHCTILAAPNAPEKAAALWIKGNTDIDISNSIIYADGYAIAFTNPDNSKDRRISNTLWFGDEGLCAPIVSNKIDERDKVESDKKLKLPKYFKVKNNFHSPPQFVDDKKGIWRLVKGVPGTKKAEDGKDLGMIFEE